VAEKQNVIGRFAPSPTGALHLGSLYTALASYLDVRSKQGQWLLRIDDIDCSRNVDGASSAILYALDALGLHWDADVVYQSQHHEYYEAALMQLSNNNMVYRCTCSRKNIDALIYPGSCREKVVLDVMSYAWRLKTDQRIISFYDEGQGLIHHALDTQHGDFIIKRKDRLFAYQLAVVVDDYLQGVTHVMRGCDLIDSTPKQIYLQSLLNLAQPCYHHLPILVDSFGAKLSKQTRAPVVDLTNPEWVLFRLLGLLSQNPPAVLAKASVSEILQWAISNWQPHVLRGLQAIKLNKC